MTRRLHRASLSVKVDDDGGRTGSDMTTIGGARKTSLGMLALLMAGVAGGAIAGADMTARQVTELLFNGGPAADLSGKDLRELDLAGLDFKGARLAGSNLYGADLAGANLKGSDLSGARLDRATLINTDLSEANLEEATILRPNTSSSFTLDPREAPTFRGARMAGSNLVIRLVGADFHEADLTGAIFGTIDPRREVLLTSQVVMDACDFSEAKLSGARLAGSSLRFARFGKADLRGADFTGADLTRADFSGADLTGANVTRANLDEADFRGAKGVTELRGLSLAVNRDRALIADGP